MPSTEGAGPPRVDLPIIEYYLHFVLGRWDSLGRVIDTRAQHDPGVLGAHGLKVARARLLGDNPVRAIDEPVASPRKESG
jgi:hypothetical protein